MLRAFTFFTAFLYCVVAAAQQKTGRYKLNGEIKASSGQMTLYTGNGKFSTEVRNGKFYFSDSIEGPVSAELILRNDSSMPYRSGVFFIDKGTQTILCNKDSMDEIPAISNRTMDEYKIFLKMQKPITDEITKGINSHGRKFTGMEKDSLTREWNRQMYHYATGHPNSYVVFWILFGDFPKGYDPIFDSIFNVLSGQIRNSSPGKKMSERLRALAQLRKGNAFPVMHLRDTTGAEVVFPKPALASNYTLVDFWYSHCSSCRGQFPRLKSIYSGYKDKGFRIVGISTDQGNAIPAWKNIIKKDSLIWPQYRDDDQKNVKTFSIDFYPTNFLLDKDGIIVARNITMENLQETLEGK